MTNCSSFEIQGHLIEVVCLLVKVSFKFFVETTGHFLLTFVYDSHPLGWQ